MLVYFAENVDTQTVGGQLRTFIETGAIRTDLLEPIFGPEPSLEAMAAIVHWQRTPEVGDAFVSGGQRNSLHCVERTALAPCGTRIEALPEGASMSAKEIRVVCILPDRLDKPPERGHPDVHSVRPSSYQPPERGHQSDTEVG